MAEGRKISALQWVHQTYQSQWKGHVDISTVAAGDHVPSKPHWICTMTVSGAVLQDKQGRNVTLDSITVETEARSKKAAEQQAAEKVYDTLIEQGWYDPNAAPTSKTSGSVSRAFKFITDSTPANEANPLAYLDISKAGRAVGRIVLELFRYKKGSTLEEHAPLAVDNFLALCRGVEVGGRCLSYCGVPITRIMRRFIIQAGDVVNRDGTGGAHIHTSYGDHYPDEGLEDKNYRFRHPFMLACANLGLEDTNSSQFFITLAPTHSLDGQHTCFGKVLAGYGVVKEIESLCDDSTDAPPCPVVIEAAGELPPGSDLSSIPAVSGGGWPLWPEDQGPPAAGSGLREAAFRLHIAGQLKEAGNTAYKQGDAATGKERYVQAARYLSWTSFKLRTPSGDVDLTTQEQRALWDCEVLLLSNTAAAQLKLGEFRAALATCQELLHRNPSNVKGLLRAGQARIGLGPAEYSAASSLLQEALSKAQEQQLPTRDIVAELHRLRGLQQQHSVKQRAKFSAAFAAGLLHHPADDRPPSSPPAAAATGDASIAAAAAAAARLRHVAPPKGLRAVGPVPPERVIDGAAPVLVDDAWGTHLLVADDSEGEADDAADGHATGSSSSYSQGLMAKLQRMGLLDKGYGPQAAAGDDIGDDGYEEGDEYYGGEGGGYADGGGFVDDAAGWGQGSNGCHNQAPAGPMCEQQGPPGANGDSANSSNTPGQDSQQQQQQDGVDLAAADQEPGVPEEYEINEAAAAGVAVMTSSQQEQHSYGDGALGALPRKVLIA